MWLILYWICREQMQNQKQWWGRASSPFRYLYSGLSSVLALTFSSQRSPRFTINKERTRNLLEGKQHPFREDWLAQCRSYKQTKVLFWEASGMAKATYGEQVKRRILLLERYNFIPSIQVWEWGPIKLYILYANLKTGPLQSFLETVCGFVGTLRLWIIYQPKLSYDRNQLSSSVSRCHFGQCLLSACYVSGTMPWAEDTEKT